MKRHIPSALAVVAALIVGFMIGSPSARPAVAPDDEGGATGFAAVAGEIGAQDVSGPYTVQEGWPKDLSTLPGHEKWTWGAGQGIFAESPNRVYLLFRGELPNLKEPAVTRLPQVGPSIQFPVGGLPWRSATATALPGSGGTGQDPEKGMENWRGQAPPYRELGVDARWEHCLVVVDAEGNIIEEWTQWDKIFKRPHSVYISPYDPAEARVARRRSHARDLQVHQRRQAARADHRHAHRARRRRDALQPADVHGVGSRRQLLRRRRIQRHARGQVRQPAASSCWTGARRAKPARKRVPTT